MEATQICNEALFSIYHLLFALFCSWSRLPFRLLNFRDNDNSIEQEREKMWPNGST